MLPIIFWFLLIPKVFHPIPENQIYRDIQVTVSEKEIHVKLLARASEATWMKWIQRTEKKVLRHNQLLQHNPLQNKKDGTNRLSSDRAADNMLPVLKFVPQNQEETVDWLKEEKNLQYILKVCELQTFVILGKRAFPVQKKSVRHSGRHHWAVEMQFVVELKDIKEPGFWKNPGSFQLNLPPGMAAIVPTTGPGNSKDSLADSDRAGFRFGSKAKESSEAIKSKAANVQSGWNGSEGKGEKKSLGKSKFSDSEVAPPQSLYRLNPGYQSNFSVGNRCFSDFGGLIRRGLRVRGDAEIDRTDHAVLVVRSEFQYKGPMKTEDRLWAQLTIPDLLPTANSQIKD